MIDMNDPKFWPNLFDVVLEGTGETLYMVLIATIITVIVGLPLGVLLVATERNGFLSSILGSRALARVLNAVLSFIVNLGRSVPFVILMIALIPVTRWLVGSFIGTGPAIVPLTLVAIPFFARLVEIAVKEVDPGLFEASESLGASRWQLVRRVILPEAMPAIVLGLATTFTSIVNFSAMVGVVGGGGLGNVALSYGWQRYSWMHVVVVIVVLFAIVQIAQLIANFAARRLSRQDAGRTETVQKNLETA